MNDEQRHPVDVLAEEFAMRLRAGEAPSMDDYIQSHPEHAEQIRAMFPSIAIVERVSQREEQLKTPASIDSCAQIRQPMPESLGDFQILREIGRGGMGVVYEAQQRSLKRRVALKVVGSMASSTQIQRERFRREAESAAALHHTNIVPVFGSGEDQGLQYYAMQLIDGVPLSDVVQYLNAGHVNFNSKTRAEHPGNENTVAQSLATTAHSKPASFNAVDAARSLLGERTDRSSRTEDTSKLRRIRDAETISAAQTHEFVSSRPASQAAVHGFHEVRKGPVPQPAAKTPLSAQYYRKVASLVAQAANALEHAHHQGVLHRDIKPGNLLLDRDGTVWVSDFGLARKAELDGITQTGEIVGTLKYMAPEQLRGEFDARSDIYSLGVTLFELLTLRPAIESPHGRLSGGATAERIPKLRALRPEIPVDLETITLKACNWEPRHRYQSAAELEQDLICFLEARPISARPITPPERLWRWSRRNPAIATLSAATMGLLVAIAGLLGVGYRQKQLALAAVQQQYERAESNLLARTEALAVAERERLRAGTNLDLAIEAFEAIIGNIASRGGAESLLNDLEDGSDASAAADATLSAADITLLENMLNFFDRFAQENSKDLGLQSANAHRRVGDIQQQLGRLQDAEKSYQLALDKYLALATHKPNDDSIILLQSGIHNELMVLAARRGDMAQARASFDKAKQLLESTPGLRSSRDGRFALAKTLSGFASLGSRFGLEVRMRPRLPFRRGPPPPDRAVGKGNPLQSARIKREAETNAEALGLLKALVAEDGKSTAYRFALASAYRNEVRIALFNENWKQADESLKASVDLLESLCREFPESDAFKYQLADTLCTAIAFGPADALRFARATKLCDELIAKQPNAPEYRALRASTLSRFAAAQFALNRKDRAISTMHEAAAYQRELAKQFPDVVLYQVSLVQSLQHLADMLLERKDVDSATKALDEAITVAEQFSKHSRMPGGLKPQLVRLQERRNAIQARTP